jgi:hypothetical protein
MKNKVLVLAVAIYLSIGGVGTALALTEPTLTTVLDDLTENGIHHYYQGHYTPVSGSDFSFNPTSNSVEVIAGDEAKWSADKNLVGYCLVSTPENKHNLFSYGLFSVGSTVEFSPGGTFELYIQPNPKVNTWWYTITSQNTDKQNHMKVYQIDNQYGGGYFLGFEDGDQTGTWDYQDVVLKVQNVNVNVPEFPTIALPIGAMLGLIFMIRRKKGDM